jgi:predicted transcriptional regulator
MFLTVKQKILVTLHRHGPLQNSGIAKRVGITEQWCSKLIKTLKEEELVESELLSPKRINRLSRKGFEVATHLKEICEKVGG